ncbi:hypothetical protein Z951_24385 [Streptomyces sp. PRh5]|nr:hypothetical protein Z951_24385 [Streptomyces sp. PRh5]
MPCAAHRRAHRGLRLFTGRPLAHLVDQGLQILGPDGAGHFELQHEGGLCEGEGGLLLGGLRHGLGLIALARLPGSGEFGGQAAQGPHQLGVAARQPLRHLGGQVGHLLEVPGAYDGGHPFEDVGRPEQGFGGVFGQGRRQVGHQTAQLGQIGGEFGVAQRHSAPHVEGLHETGQRAVPSGRHAGRQQQPHQVEGGGPLVPRVQRLRCAGGPQHPQPLPPVVVRGIAPVALGVQAAEPGAYGAQQRVLVRHGRRQVGFQTVEFGDALVEQGGVGGGGRSSAVGRSRGRRAVGRAVRTGALRTGAGRRALRWGRDDPRQRVGRGPSGAVT